MPAAADLGVISASVVLATGALETQAKAVAAALDMVSESADSTASAGDAASAGLQAVGEAASRSTAAAEEATRVWNGLADGYVSLSDALTLTDEQLRALGETTAGTTDSATALDTALASLVETADMGAAALDSLSGAADANTGALDANAGAAEAAGAAHQKAAAESDGLAKSLGKLVMPATIAEGLVVGLGAVALHMSGDFHESMTQLVTGAGEAQSNLQLVTDGILAMAPQVGESTTQLAQGLYMIESAGYHGAAGLDVLKASAEGAKVGNADLGVVADAVTTVLNDYSASGVTAANAVNALTATVASGKTHLQDLSGALAQVLPTASAAKVGLNDVMGAMATMTSEGVPAANAATYLRQMIIALDAPASKGAKTLKEVGLTTADVAKEMQVSLPATLKMITDAVGKKFPVGSAAYVAAIKDISGGSKQMQGMLDLTGDHLKTFQDNVANISDQVKKGGDSINGWALAQQDLNTQLAQAGATLQVMMIQIGTALEPVARELIATVMPVLKQFGDWAATHGQQIATAFAILASVIGGVLVTALGAAAVAFVAANTAAVGISLGVGAAIGVIAGLALALKDAYEHSEPFRAAVQHIASFFTGTLIPAVTTVWTHFQQLATTFATDVRPELERLLPDVQAVASWLGDHLQQALEFLAPKVTDASHAVGQFADDLGTRLGPALHTVFDFITTALTVLGKAWTDFWPTLSDALRAAWGVIQGIVEVAWSLVSGIIKIGLDVLSGNWKQAWTDLGTMLSGIWDGIKQILSSALSGLVNIWLDGIQKLLEGLAKIPGPVGDMATKALDALEQLRSGSNSKMTDTATQGVVQAAKLKEGVLLRTAEMHQQVAKELDGQRQDILKQLADTTDPAKQHALEMKLKVVDQAEQMHKQAAAEALALAQEVANDTAKMEKDATANAQGTHDGVVNALKPTPKDGKASFDQLGAFISQDMQESRTLTGQQAQQIANSLKPAWTYVMAFTASSWGYVEQVLSTIWAILVKLAADNLQQIGTIVHNNWTFISADVKHNTQVIGGIVSDHLDFLLTVIEGKHNGIRDGILKPYIEAAAAIGGVLNGLKQSAFLVFNEFLSGVESWANGFAAGIDSIADSLGVQPRDPVKPLHLPRLGAGGNGGGGSGGGGGVPSGGGNGHGRVAAYAAGTDFHPGGVALVGEEGPELVHLPRGTSVLPAGPTEALMGGITGAYAGGVGDFFSGLLDRAKTGLGDISSLLGDSPTDLLGKALAAAGVNTSAVTGVPGLFGTIGGSALQALKQYALPAIGKWLSSLLSTDVGGGSVQASFGNAPGLLPGFPLMNQLAQHDINDQNDCVPTSLASGVSYLLHHLVSPVGLKDEVYGASYIGGQLPTNYMSAVQKLGVQMQRATGSASQLIADIVRNLQQGHPVLGSIPSNWNVISHGGSTHEVAFAGYDAQRGLLTAMNPWRGFFQTASPAWWAPRLQYGEVDPLVRMARGGVLREMVLGRGMSSGRGYLLGESGPETVVPGDGSALSGGGDVYHITVPVTVQASQVDGDPVAVGTSLGSAFGAEFKRVMAQRGH